MNIISTQEIGHLFYWKSSLMYSWREFDITMQKLCSGDWDRTLQLSVYDWNRLARTDLMMVLLMILFVLLVTRSGNHELIGKNTCTLRDITMERYCDILLLVFLYIRIVLVL